ncbi:D-alanyl-lipoteichoic acid biosynthesis protein DltD [Allofustis seminis]|uniref:D-alanyl-lipoteichoic acid biosynthesis protein DltD n=1 Tax=Allofustis seminis TaxID=166939 RepID=UPI0003808D1B|nr:D-alanyl-lipoteichoic acid biosynthesis protein DltD [Allofustis seminis]
MRKLLALVLATLLLGITIVGLNAYSTDVITREDNVAKAYKLNTDERNNSKSELSMLLDDNTAVVLGSSELKHPDTVAYPSYLFGNSASDFKMVLCGRSCMQSLHHAMTVGAYADILPKHKVVLILSPQWFSRSGAKSEAYASRFSEKIYLQMMENPSLSDDLKQRVTERLETLLSADEKQLARLNLYKEKYLEHNPNLLKMWQVNLFRSFMDFKNNYMLAEQLSAEASADAGTVKVEELDFDGLLKDAEVQGAKEITNNEFGIKDRYYNNRIKDQFKALKGSKRKVSYLKSPEYDDFELFIDICKELDIEPLIVSIPVNGYWYDYTEFSKQGRLDYYEKIRTLCEDYGVALADFSDREYEKYFFEDPVHIGWKGWVYFDEAVYNFYHQQD